VRCFSHLVSRSCFRTHIRKKCTRYASLADRRLIWCSCWTALPPHHCTVCSAVAGGLADAKVVLRGTSSRSLCLCLACASSSNNLQLLGFTSARRQYNCSPLAPGRATSVTHLFKQKVQRETNPFPYRRARSSAAKEWSSGAACEHGNDGILT